MVQQMYSSRKQTFVTTWNMKKRKFLKKVYSVYKTVTPKNTEN